MLLVYGNLLAACSAGFGVAKQSPLDGLSLLQIQSGVVDSSNVNWKERKKMEIEVNDLLHDCCKFSYEHGLMPLERWGDTPREKRNWWRLNDCNSVVGNQGAPKCLLVKKLKAKWEPFEVNGPPCSKNNTEVPCFDPAQCVPGTAKRPAITFTFDQAIDWTKKVIDDRHFFKAAKKLGAALILMIPAEDAPDATNAKKLKISHALRKKLQRFYNIVEVPWVTPPKLSAGIPKDGGCCGAREFMKLHSVGMDQFDAVINLDNDMHVASQASIDRLRQLFDCAASGMLLTARGSTSSVNGAFFAVRPQKKLLNELLSELQTAHVANDLEGWNGYGWGPEHKHDDFRIQGFFEYMFYLRGSKHVRSEQIDPCGTNLQGFCPKLSCNATVFRHHGKCYNELGKLVR